MRERIAVIRGTLRPIGEPRPEPRRGKDGRDRDTHRVCGYILVPTRLFMAVYCLSIPARHPVQSTMACQVAERTFGAGIGFGGGGSDPRSGRVSTVEGQADLTWLAQLLLHGGERTL